MDDIWKLGLLLGEEEPCCCRISSPSRSTQLRVIDYGGSGRLASSAHVGQKIADDFLTSESNRSPNLGFSAHVGQNGAIHTEIGTTYFHLSQWPCSQFQQSNKLYEDNSAHVGQNGGTSSFLEIIHGWSASGKRGNQTILATYEVVSNRFRPRGTEEW